MKILLIHNSYYYQGGEDEVVESEKRMLKERGHIVIEYRRSNKEIEAYSFFRKIRFFWKEAVWSKEVYEEIKAIIRRENPDVAHIHNTFLMVTPSVYDACYDERLPVVQTLHNFRFLCPNAIFYRQGQICEKCVLSGKCFGVIYKCWKGSAVKTFFLVRILEHMRCRKILENKVARFICLNRFAEKKFVEYGLPREKISIKPNFLDKAPEPTPASGGYAIYVGALREYKGVNTLVNAWGKVGKGARLKIVGDGPLKEELVKSSAEGVEFLGQKTLAETIDLIKKAAFLVLPSICYETFPRVIVEAYACGVPVITSRLGGLPELVEEGKTGFLFRPGDADALAEKIRVFFDNPEVARRMGETARKVYDEKYIAEENYRILMDVYQQAIEAKNKELDGVKGRAGC
ncbi:MAG: glycosyltransferase family 4 protein [Candidatus Omnitrophica bacterium]|nr:glycosyltransferase family 4 protein [Candidatus Omnitrophota bacterium]